MVLFEGATGEILQDGVQIGSTVVGTIQPNGYFIFYVDYKDWRRLVRVNNLGTFVKAGISLPSSSTWQDSNSWFDVSQTISLTLDNFQGSKGN